MLISNLFHLLFGMVNGLIALLPAGSPPDFFLQVAPTIHTVVAGANGLGAWIPWALAISVMASVFGLWLVLSGVSAVRYLLGWIPTMGGA